MLVDPPAVRVAIDPGVGLRMLKSVHIKVQVIVPRAKNVRTRAKINLIAESLSLRGPKETTKISPQKVQIQRLILISRIKWFKISQPTNQMI